MASLTSLLPKLAPMLGLSPAALYERQRALVRLGDLPNPKGRGRGSGAEATPETVAILLLAVMVTDNLSDTDHRVGLLANVQSDRTCKFTKTSVFSDAVAAILASQRMAERAIRIRVFRTELAGQIYFTQRTRGETTTDWTTFGRLSEFPERLEVEADIAGPVIERIERSLRTAITET